MNKKSFDIAVYIGRFQPFHQGHLACVREGLDLAHKVLILIGSVNRRPSARNPWSYAERRRMIRSSLNPAQKRRVIIRGIRDFKDDHDWITQVKQRVEKLNTTATSKIALIGHRRDASSFYLDCFPGWRLIELAEYQDISASRIRDVFLTRGDIQSVTRPVADLMRSFSSMNVLKDALDSRTLHDHCHPDVMGGVLDAV